MDDHLEALIKQRIAYFESRARHMRKILADYQAAGDPESKTAVVFRAIEENAERLRAPESAGEVIDIQAVADESTIYRGLSVGAAVRSFLETNRAATLEQIRQGLDAGGIQWKKYPKRAVALAVANRPDLYRMEGDLVKFRDA